MHCKRAECVQEYQEMVAAVDAEVLVALEYRHCDAEACHSLYMGDGEGAHCAHCKLALCGLCQMQESQGSFIDEDFLCVVCLELALKECTVGHCKSCGDYAYQGEYGCSVCKRLLCSACGESLSREYPCSDCNK